ncbi:hypothetical protein COCCADRAFT_93268 [Bipolaris zeicola 26-R-13]|uniref:Uncharacterized protein n=1 Tax=Cochliobolus carbonum (strain 26-R-13) TaxID=930089 RepID=W6Y451_COCC2|nr:uncharacterized protein COCCADRAFT_93268 [Bipolaris zeicola 26-R-13]EUC34497.1 hypothetical protein COCCADRAFT_93268 [Bipolaris zeicola 26-R-13]
MAHPKIPASVILSPRELKLYKRWQCLHANIRPNEQGYIPTAGEYEDFQQWLKRQDSGYFSDIFDDITGHIAPPASETTKSTSNSPVASVCQHTMHPTAAGQLQSRCPVCTIDMHVKYMHVLSQALENAGGRAPSCTLTSSEHQDTVYNAWCKGKIGALKELSVIENMAAQESEWSARHPEESHENVQTASKALDLYWAETTGHVDERPRPKRDSAVAFAEDTDFEPGRPNPYFHRRSPRYEPGKYTVVDDDGDDDDEDMISEDSEDYSHAKSCHVTGAEEPVAELLESFQNLDTVDDIEDDDGDSDWEDVESDDEYSDEDSEGSCTYWEVEEEASFIVFGED